MRAKAARQILPRWHVERAAEPPQQRSATVIPFPDPDGRGRRVLTYRRALVIPDRQAAPSPLPGRRAALVLALLLAATGLAMALPG